MEFQILASLHHRYNLPFSLHKRLAKAAEGDIVGWVDLPDHLASLGVDDHTLIGLVPVVVAAQDAYFIGFELTKDGLAPGREFWDFNELPCPCSKPEHLYRAQIAIVTGPAGNVDLLS